MQLSIIIVAAAVVVILLLGVARIPRVIVWRRTAANNHQNLRTAAALTLVPQDVELDAHSQTAGYPLANRLPARSEENTRPKYHDGSPSRGGPATSN
jgi:hypothetical protein